MKHLELFENWHSAQTCSHCKGTGLILSSKKDSMEKLIKSSTPEHFAKFIDDSDFVENAVELFKETGVFDPRIAYMVDSLKLGRQDMQEIIKKTEEGFDGVEDALNANGDGQLGIDEKIVDKLKETLRNKSKVLSILRGR